MRLSEPITLEQAASYLKLPFIGNPETLITGINVVHKVEEGDLTFVDFHKYYDRSLNSKASVVIIDKETDRPGGKGLILSDDPFGDFNKLTLRFRPFVPSQAMISPTAEIGEGTHLQPGVFVGNDVKIGKNCLIHAHVTICDHTTIGDNVIIHPNTVIGGDAFFFKTRNGENFRYDRMHSCGRTIIEDDVEIGSNCTIDRGATGDTVIGKGTKLDNLVHIGHGAVIGKNCLIAAQCGIAGKTILEDEVILWGQVGVSKELVIGKKAIVLAKSGVGKNLEGGKSYFGAPAEEARKKWKELAISGKLPQIWDKLERL
ncbi:MAG: UDP-3-O-(3-hydroxymyristoyl)glucosamine N-acyltransferase [Chitinophagales bacterium]|nr:UDP-3-O-(3-hydroxymyristoyl)glucosamine N-acyltransferase [Chitinophagales bacterium]